MFIAILQITLWLFIIPMVVGSLFTRVERQADPLVFQWISGQMLLWAVFQLLCVPMVLLEWEFYRLETACLIAAALLVAAALGSLIHRKKKGGLHVVREPLWHYSRKACIFWALFFGLLIFQLLQSVFLAYADGDDAYYVTLSAMTQDSGRMYQKVPYTGKFTELDVRHGLAPFPMWISFLARMADLPAAMMAHVVVSTVLIAMTYGIFYLLGRHLFAAKREQLPLFLLFTQLLVLFGDYSFQTAENFMIARSRQGKAALGNIIIPMLLYLLYLLLEKLQEQKRMTISYWVLLLSVMTAACLCSTMGALLTALLVAVTGLCAGVCYRRVKPVLAMAGTCIPCVCYALLYLLL